MPNTQSQEFSKNNSIQFTYHLTKPKYPAIGYIGSQLLHPDGYFIHTHRVFLLLHLHPDLPLILLVSVRAALLIPCDPTLADHR